ncbi:MAG: SufB/SufD family protein, partial [Vicinamibacterales bacterium]
MTHSLEQYKQAFASTRQRRPPGEPPSLARTREDALSRFLALGFPTTRDEEWRFTSVAPIADHVFTLAAGASPDASHRDLVPLRLPDVFGAELVFVDGRYAPALSNGDALPKGVRAGSLAAYVAGHADGAQSHLTRVAPFDRRAFVALNTALFTDGAYIHVPAHTVLERPIHVLFISTGATNGHSAMSHPRVLVVLDDDSQAAVVESYAGPDGARYFTNVVTEIALGDHAVLDHYKLQHESTEAYHVGAIFVKAGRSANCASHSISLGGSLVRNDVVAVLDGEGVECTLNGLYLADGRRLVDNHTTIDHAMPHCGSREIYKGILADRARGVFNGKIIVRPDAQKTDAKQTNRALLLSE